MVSPVRGMTRVIPPITTNTWKAMTKDSPAQSSFPKPSRTPMPVRMPRWVRIR